MHLNRERSFCHYFVSQEIETNFFYGELAEFQNLVNDSGKFYF